MIGIYIPDRLLFVYCIHDLEYLVANKTVICVYKQYDAFFATVFADPNEHISHGTHAL